jgi:negative regulator of sigma-B (phosphoserine phosphatase)
MEAVTCPFIEWGVAGLAVKGAQQSGDRGFVQPVARGALVAVVDGLGHGSGAVEAAERAVEILRGHANETVTSLVQRCHEATRGTRGVVIGLAMINGIRGTLTWLGVGNVVGVVISGGDGHSQRRQALLQRAGIVGAHLPSLTQALVPLMPRDLVILATDGIRTDARWQTILTGSPQEIADRMLAKYRTETDDALVLVSRYLGRGARQ